MHYPVSGNSYKPLMHDTGNDVVKFPTKPKHPDLPETSPNRSPTPTSQTTSPAKVLCIQSRRTPVLALPRTRAPLPSGSPPLPICLLNSVRQKTNASGETVPH